MSVTGMLFPAKTSAETSAALARKEASVEVDQNTLLLHVTASHLIGDRLRQAPDVMDVKPSPMRARQPPVPKATWFYSSLRQGRKSRFWG
jgi:hypothetical protein